MSHSPFTKTNNVQRSPIRRPGLTAALAAALALGLCGCNEDEAWDAFRAGASDQLQAGVEAIVLGTVNGAFAAFDLGSGDAGSANTSGATAGTSDASTTP